MSEDERSVITLTLEATVDVVEDKQYTVEGKVETHSALGSMRFAVVIKVVECLKTRRLTKIG